MPHLYCKKGNLYNKIYLCRFFHRNQMIWHRQRRSKQCRKQIRNPGRLLAAGIYFTGLFGGYLVAVLLTAYVLLVEDDEWLRRSSVKAVILWRFCP